MWVGVAQGVGSGLFPPLHAAPPSAPFGSSSLGNIGSSTTTTSLHTGRKGTNKFSARFVEYGCWIQLLLR